MNTAQIIDYLSHKTWTWQRAFCNFYLLEHNLYTAGRDEELEPAMLVKRCNNDDDLQEMRFLAEFIDSTEQEMINIISDYRFFRSIPWQYDFVETVEKKSGFKIKQTLNLDALTDAYCIALFSDKLDLNELTEQLDETYRKLYASAARKQLLHKRNLSLILESLGRHRSIDNAAGLNYRELVDAYLPAYGLSSVLEALHHAYTDDIKLTPEERAAFAFAYYSPYFYDEEELKFGKIPGSSIFACVEERLQEERGYRESLKQKRWQAQDEDEEDDITDALEETHNAVYVDPQERCLIDTHYGDVLYANVYIERVPQDFLNTSLPDFIRYHKGCLYTVEFVDDIKKLNVAQELLDRLNQIKHEMLSLETKQLRSPQTGLSEKERQKYAELSEERATCYYVCD